MKDKEIKQDFKDLKKEIVSKEEIILLIENAILKQGVVRELTPQTPRTNLRKKADKLLDKVEIMREMASMLELGHTTTEMYKEIVDVKGLCRKTCFYNYLKLVHKKSSQTPRTRFKN